MLLRFGLSLDDGSCPKSDTATAGSLTVGPKKMLKYLEEGLGVSLPDEDIEYLRVEQFRQALKVHLSEFPDAFYAKSYQADDLATAAELLSRRDELKAAGWQFSSTNSDQLPQRLRVLAEIEDYWNNKFSLKLFPGLADRQSALLERADQLGEFIDKIQLTEPLELLPPLWRRLLSKLQQAGINLLEPLNHVDDSDQHTDLSAFRNFLQTGKKPSKFSADGSLLILRAYRETHSAAWLAKLIAKNSSFQPAILAPFPGPALDHAFKVEGLPGLGIPSASIARPSLQVLKLLPVFLWEPLDPYKLMEFVSLSLKPLDEELSQRIALFLADTPGLYSDRWFGMLAAFFEQYLPEKMGTGHPEIQAIRRQYDFWFNRKRIDHASGRVSKKDVREMYAYLQHWARDIHQNTTEKAGTFLTLAKQAGKLVELFDALPEEDLSFLELERMVRTIYQPTPINDQIAEENNLPVVFHADALTDNIDHLIWWEFIEKEPNYFFSRWYPSELSFLVSIGVELDEPKDQNERLVWARRQPFFRTKSQLTLCISDYSLGSKVHPHPLYGDLEAAFGNLSAITYQIDELKGAKPWQSVFSTPDITTELPISLGVPAPFVTFDADKMGAIEKEETPTSLEQLVYYPYQWVFRHRLKLRKSSILSLIEDNRLFGNLAHRLLEQLLRDSSKTQWTKSEVAVWIEQKMPELLRKEGASLLLYGREPERIAFTKYLKNSAWNLLLILQQNNWKVKTAEEQLEGYYGAIQIRGRADLVLERENELTVIDLKWQGKSRYSSMLKNAEDLQLSLYAKLVREGVDNWAHSAFYIIRNGELLIRNSEAFKGIQPVGEETDHREIYNNLLLKTEATYQWRLDQLASGKIEIRCKQTADFLEEEYNEDLMELLEMKHNDAPFDDYQVLIQRIS